MKLMNLEIALRQVRFLHKQDLPRLPSGNYSSRGKVVHRRQQIRHAKS